MARSNGGGSASIGIELDNNGDEPFPDVQIDVLLGLLTDLQQRYNIPRANFIGHADVAPGRKSRSECLVPMAEAGRERLQPGAMRLTRRQRRPAILALALTALGYSPLTPDASRRAFLLHYAAGDESLSADSRRALAFACSTRELATDIEVGNDVQGQDSASLALRSHVVERACRARRRSSQLWGRW